MKYPTQRDLACDLLKRFGVTHSAIDRYAKTGEVFTCSNTFIGCRFLNDKQDQKTIAELRARGLEVYAIWDEKYRADGLTLKHGFHERSYLCVTCTDVMRANENVENGGEFWGGISNPLEGYGFDAYAYVTSVTKGEDSHGECGLIQVCRKNSGIVKTA